MMLPTQKKCLIRIREGGSQVIEALLLGFAPIPPKQFDLNIVGSRGEYPQTHTVEALVELVNFDKGKIYQLPLEFVKVVDEFPIAN